MAPESREQPPEETEDDSLIHPMRRKNHAGPRNRPGSRFGFLSRAYLQNAIGKGRKQPSPVEAWEVKTLRAKTISLRSCLRITSSTTMFYSLAQRNSPR
jgi:hypothetical protein